MSEGAEAHEKPPTQAALTFHILRANYQCYTWKNPQNAKFQALSPNGHGSVVEGNTINLVDNHGPGTKQPAAHGKLLNLQEL